ncbi:hypothetical protein U1Q18_029997 [Sarracenia purpurea var. burkii]
MMRLAPEKRMRLTPEKSPNKNKGGTKEEREDCRRSGRRRQISSGWHQRQRRSWQCRQWYRRRRRRLASSSGWRQCQRRSWQCRQWYRRRRRLATRAY